MKKIFVIGNIGSGKSTFCEYLGEELERESCSQSNHECASVSTDSLDRRGQVAVINLDKLGHDALQNVEVRAAIKAAFGPVRSRVELAHIAFSDATSLNKLNQITHPYILHDLRLRLKEASQAGLQFAVVEQTAVAEKDDAFLKLADTVVCVNSPKIYSETPNRVNAQLSQKQLTGLADVVVDNNAGLDELQEKARQVADQILFQIECIADAAADKFPQKITQQIAEQKKPEEN